MVDSEGRYSTEKQDSVQAEVLSRERSVPRVQISQSSEGRYSTGRFEELSRSGRRFCPSPDQSVEACQFLHDEAEVMSDSRSAQSSPVKSSIGFWLSLLRSTSCLSHRTLSLLPQIGTTKSAVVQKVSIRTGAGKYSGLIAGQKFTGRIEIAQMNREARGVSMHESRTWCQVSSKLSVNRSTTCRRA
ncbi:hypothetical protein F2Q68_00015277 [Brassica cretica]|uniref:Uncharacterized protein n=1 Tax=Brassica cretica TaxID=69181 RepID=A0A8S9HTP8_BRACR|nr:hypothetical protein F2Q68_00015277 [Brassica cretica]